jgi:hypothetical protein
VGRNDTHCGQMEMNSAQRPASLGRTEDDWEWPRKHGTGVLAGGNVVLWFHRQDANSTQLPPSLNICSSSPANG